MAFEVAMCLSQYTGKQPIWNSVETDRQWLNFGIGKLYDIIKRYSFKLPTFVQYFVVLSKSIFLHFQSISNKLKKVVSIRQYLGKYAFINRATRFVRFWKVPRQTNAYVSNKWPLKLPCSCPNSQGSSPFENPLTATDNS
ncbi:hypothetical protein T03_7804 [Trichinella britovi]|uniref:Uncharacterized protein n=1 Tax=Trichinella britovi TaxID=45882 RepID=A0A0V1CWW6_TRIBR|nr:hypothetical protein T03_7804 [Trichinella britovi]